MAERHITEIQNHRLAHIPRLRIDPVIFESKFSHGCSMYNCNASCCQDGVMVDVVEKDRILKNADLIKRYMEQSQVSDPAEWFDQVIEVDSDFPSGGAVGTRSNDRGCVFLMGDGRCVLQYVAEQEQIPRHSLKPFYCFAFPVTIESGVLTIDDPDFTNRPECCSMIPGGTRSVLDVCSQEFEFVLGKDGMKELKGLLRDSG